MDGPPRKRKKSDWALLIGVPLLLASILGVLHFRKIQREELGREIVLAARRGDFGEVRALLERGADPDGRLVPDEDGTMNMPPDRPLVLAVEAGNKEAVALLIDAGAELNADRTGGQLILAALYTWDREMLAYLFQRGVDANSFPVGFSANNALHAIIDLAWREEHPADEALELAKIALKHGCDPNFHGMHGRTPFIDAVSWEQEGMVKLLLENGARIEEADDKGWDAMDFAAFRSNAAITDLLAAHGGQFAIQEAVALGRIGEVRKMLATDASLIGLKCIQGKSLLGLALERGNAELAMLLIESGSDLSAQTERGESLLHLAAAGGSARMVRYLIDEGADVMARDQSGDTPLHETTYADRHEAAEVLIAAGADIDARGTSQITPLLWAAAYNSPKVARLLIRSGADPNAVGAYDGALPLGSACHYAGRDKVPESVRVLLELGADVNALGAKKRPAIHWAAGWFGGEPLVRFLLEQGADPDIRDAAGESALDIAERDGKEKVAALLREWSGKKQ